MHAWPHNAHADAPDWLRAAARASLPNYPEETNAVLLLDERVTTIKDNGEIKTVYRRAYKILRPEARSLATVVVYFDDETRLTFLKAWSIPAEGKDFEVKEKDAIETALSSGMLYQDTRYKLLRIPAAEPGNVVGYEYEQKRRPSILQDRWWFQDEIPVKRARFVLQLPSGWEFESNWFNHAPQQPQSMGENRWGWELEDIPAIEHEPSMPTWRVVAGWMAVTYFPRRVEPARGSHASWRDVGLWYAQLAAPRRQSSPDIRQKVADLTVSASTLLDKMKALAAFVQRDVRYVAIEIGIGGYQPHFAQDIFFNRYGDCKDKVTLFNTMLREIGVESHYVLVHTKRGAVVPNFPSALSFNHVIAGIRLPEDVSASNLYAVRNHEKLCRLLFFDPTDPSTPIGYLPPALQSGHGLLVTEGGGELLQLPLLMPATNRLIRSAKLILSPTGTLSGEVQEIRWGAEAVERRNQLLDALAAERIKVLEQFLGRFLGSFVLTGSQVDNLEKFDESLVLRYRFVANNYAKSAGSLLLFRPRVLGQKSIDLMEGKPRKHPVEFPVAGSESDIFEITLPTGYAVDELPPPVELDQGFAKYQSRVEVQGNVLRYTRNYQIRDVVIPVERLAELKEFFRKVAADERNSAVLKRSAQ